MSGVYIRGTEMPTMCGICMCYNADDDGVYCFLSSDIKDVSFYNKPKDCPLIAVPLHGRLIDADALMERIKNALGCYGNEYKIETTFGALLDYIKARINDATTIIEADKEEQR